MYFHQTPHLKQWKSSSHLDSTINTLCYFQHIPWTPRMLIHEPASMNMRRQAWMHDHDQIFFRIFYPCRHNIRKMFFDCKIEFLLMWKDILPCVHGWMIFMDEKRMNIILNVGNTCYFCKNLNKRNRVKTIYVGFFQNNSTNEMFKSHFKAVLHIFLIWNIFMFYNIQTIQKVKLNPIDHQEICDNLNTNYSPPRGMCPLGTKTIWNSPQHFTLPTLVQVIFYFCSLSTSCI
jgi:hypothetical protein